MKIVLIYDNDHVLSELICLALELEGFKAAEYHHNSVNCLKLLSEIKPALVLLDLRYLDEFSKKWCQSIKELDPELPLVVLSCNNNIPQMYRQCGFDDYISKPFDLKKLYNTVRKYITS